MPRLRASFEAFRLCHRLIRALAFDSINQLFVTNWRIIKCLIVGAILAWPESRARATTTDNLQRFVDRHCLECHDADSRKGGLDLTALKFAPAAATNFSQWVAIQDRVGSGEMPPKKEKQPAAAERASFTNTLGAALFAADHSRIAHEGRAADRRLNRHEYEDTLRDLLALPYLEVKEFLPEDREASGFNKVGEALDVSHVQMSRYLTAAEFALRQALAPQATRPIARTNRFYTWGQREFTGKIPLEGPLNRRTFPLVGLELRRDLMAAKNPQMSPSEEPERRARESMALVVSTYEPTEIRFGGFRAPVAGRYRLKFSGYSIWMGLNFTNVTAGHGPEPVSIYAETPPRALRKLGSFDVQPTPTENEMEVWLLAGETIRPDAARLFRSRPPDFKNPLAEADGMPGVAFGWMEVQGPFTDQWPPAGHQLLFGNLPLKDRPAEEASDGGRGNNRYRPAPGVEVVSSDPEKDAPKLLRNFLAGAYRGPVPEAEVRRFVRLVDQARQGGLNFTDAMIAGYTAVLSSPGFLYLQAQPGRLSDLAMAERLAYFLWNSAPDSELRALARRGKLHRPAVLREQTERLLNDPRSDRFVADFLDYWLDLRLITGVDPDAELYPEYQLDDLLIESMIGETQGFFRELVRRNLGITNLVTSDFVVLNSRLATHYGIAGIPGVDLHPVKLAPDSVRGGLLTQASVLKVTANGTTTSPVKRGAWIMARVVGRPPPPPLASVPAVEPDIRGATTIREQLAKHRTQPQCAACHRNIDPAGFALESFDVMGAARARYRCIGGGDRVRGVGHNSLSFHYSLGQPVDASGELPDGRPFQNVRELKQLLAADPEPLARNLLGQLAVFATGAPVRFADRPELARMLARSRAGDYGVRQLLHELVQSDLFLNK